MWFSNLDLSDLLDKVISEVISRNLSLVMIDICQWRSCIGLWNVIKSFKGGADTRGGDMIQLKLTLSLIIIIIISLLLILTTVFPSTTAGACDADIMGKGTRWVWSVFTALADCTNVIISLSFLLLLLSGDVELNPGPLTGTTSKQLLRGNHAKLAIAISGNFSRVVDALYSKGLIPQATRDDLQSTLGISNYEKATQLMTTIRRQLETSPDPDQYLINICHVLIDQQHKSLTDIATSILQQLGQSIPDAISSPYLPSDVQRYSDIMRDRYKGQHIVATDWPPRVGKDFFGRLALIEKQNSFEQGDTAWNMLRGKIDKIPSLPGCKGIAIEDILKPCRFRPPSPLRVLVDGPPGIGKTTLCRKLCNMWANGALRQYDLVLHCPLRNSKIATANTLTDLFMGVYECNEVEAVIKWANQSHGEKLLIIFDGWDELKVELRHSLLMTKKIICREQLAKCSVIVTSRSYASSSLLKLDSISRHVQVIGFNEREITKVINETLKDSEDPQLAKKLVNDFELRGDIHSLCYIPLVCSMVILVYCKLKGHLPTTLTELYDNFILQTIRRHVERTSIGTSMGVEPSLLNNLSELPPELDTTFRQLCHLAYNNLLNPRMTFTYNQLQESLSGAVKEDYLGLITSFTEYDEKTYQFIHLSIQEFLAAWWIVKSDDLKTEEVFKKHFDNDHFRMCLRFVAGLTHLKPEENYTQYFNKPLDLQCKRRPLTGFETFHCSFLYPNSQILNYYNEDCHINNKVVRNSSATLLFHLLYESQSSKLCDEFAQSFINKSFCVERLAIIHHNFDTLCLSFFFNNVSISWNHVHLENLLDYNWSLKDDKHLTAKSSSKVLEANLEADFDIYFFSPKNIPPYTSSMLQGLPLHNIQECIIKPLSEGHDYCLVLCDLLCLLQLKVLQLEMRNSWHDDKDYCPKFELSKLKHILESNSVLLELKVKFNASNKMIQLTISIIEGVTRNKTITSFSLKVATDVPDKLTGRLRRYFLSLPDDIIEQLFKNNHTLQSLSLHIPDDLLPSSLIMNIIEVNTPLTALEIVDSERKTINSYLYLKNNWWPLFSKRYYRIIAREKNTHVNTLLISLIGHLNGLQLASLNNVPVSLSDLFRSQPNLQSLSLILDTVEKITELFTILQTNTTLKGLKVEVYKVEVLISESLHDMLKQNKTLQYLEIDCVIYHGVKTIPSSYISSLANGLIHNNTLQRLKIPIPELSDTDIELLPTLFDVISQKKNFTDIGIGTYITSPDLLFSQRLIPILTHMLNMHTTIKRLWIAMSGVGYFRLENPSKFLKTILTHPSLENVRINTSRSFADDIQKAYNKELKALQEEHQPSKPLPIIDIKSYADF